ncbi:histidine phosphatase family protein [Streptomyces sp. DSM 44917]|uniref:Histidine phosphatase family protein n=1 Tax=Streptomyces boetiae TaxID=3075541 RepID=A0ABU2LDC5_9ACTN|nr:histidine phosphatase family protein [Streptomyces sp. DSM 44917]MDT0309495.1 histidine phosphatase family protein [Streptomyces sp. DSM 44917]
MPVIHLVRHGQASFGAADYDVLSDPGREQATAVGAELGRRGLRDPLLVCGTLRRQRDTAELLAKAAGFAGPARTDARWDEYDHLRLLTAYAATALDAEPPESGPGLAAANRSLQTALDAALGAWVAEAAPGPEGWPAFSGAALAALRELSEGLGAGRDAVVVTSAGVVAALCSGLLGAGPSGVVALNRVAANAGITTVTSGRSGLSLLAFNDHAHFAGERRPLLTYR